MTAPHVALFGATGRLGLLILKSLLNASDSVIVHVYARSPSKLPKNLDSNPRIQIYQGTTDDVPRIREAICGCNTVICALLGQNDFMVTSQKTLIDACEAESIPRYIASDYSLDYRSLEIADLPPKDPMIIVKRYLEERQEQGSIVSGVHILNGGFYDIMPNLIRDGEMPLFGTGNEKLDFSTYEHVADFTAHAALDESAVGFLKFREAEVSFNEIAAMLKDINGEAPKMNSMGSLADLERKLDHVRKNGPMDMSTFPMFYMSWMHSGKVSLGRDEELDNGRYPKVMTMSLKEWMREHMKEVSEK